MKMLLETDKVSVSIDGKEILNDVSISLKPGELFALFGPNGAGKSTLIRAIVSDIKYSGTIKVLSDESKSLPRRELARRVAVLNQSSQAQFSYTVFETVLMGRYAWKKGIFSGTSREDIASAKRAMELAGISDLADRSILTLSGGERQKAFLARVLCQDANILLLDEPTNNLDIRSKAEIYEVVKKWAGEYGRAVLCVSHDIDLAIMYATSAALLSNGRIVMQGGTKEVLMSNKANEVFSMDIIGYYDRLFGAVKDACPRI